MQGSQLIKIIDTRQSACLDILAIYLQIFSLKSCKEYRFLKINGIFSVSTHNDFTDSNLEI